MSAPTAPRATAHPTAAPLLRMLVSELALVLPRPRTAVTLGTLLVIPVLAAFGLRSVQSVNSSVLGAVLVSTTEFTALPLAVPVVLVAADAFAAERAYGTLDQLRIAPAGPGRLVLLKSTGVLAMALLAGFVTVAAAVLGGLVALPLGEYTLGATLGRGLLVGVWLSGQLAGFGLLLLPLSVLVRRSAAVVATGLAIMALSLAARAGPGWLVVVAPEGNWIDTTAALSRVPVDWSPVLATTLRAAVFAVLGTGFAVWLLTHRDD